MKSLTCELCGSTNILKQDGVFVCQQCGTKYSVEDAKKMLMKGDIAPPGNIIKSDASDDLANLYQLARRAREENRNEEAAKYYDGILIKDPNSWEAAFYSVYCRATNVKLSEIITAANSVENCLSSTLTLVRNNVPKDEQNVTVKEIIVQCYSLAAVYVNGAKKYRATAETSSNQDATKLEYIQQVFSARDIMYTCGSEINDIFSDAWDTAKLAVDAWKAGIDIHSIILPDTSEYDAETAIADREVMVLYAERIKEYDPDLAKEYMKRNLGEQISILKQKLSELPTSASWDRFGIGWGCFFLFLTLVFLLIITSSYFSGSSIGYWFLFGNAAAGGACIYAARPSRPTETKFIANNQKKISKITATLKEKEDALEALN